MNVLAKDLKKQTELVEQMASGTDRFRQHFHLMPVTGWLNDPNGLCEFQGVCHAFYQTPKAVSSCGGTAPVKI